MTEIIYLGRREGAKGEKAMAFITLEAFTAAEEKSSGVIFDAGNIEAASSWFAPSRKNHFLHVGGIYECEPVIVENGRLKSIRYDEMKFRRMSDTPFLGSWQTADRDVELRKAKASAIRQAAKYSNLNQAVLTVAAHYARVAPAQRRGFMLWLWDEVQRGK